MSSPGCGRSGWPSPARGLCFGACCSLPELQEVVGDKCISYFFQGDVLLLRLLQGST